MTGYVRADTANNIADGNVINAADLDGEFDGVVAAFNASTGHKHDGTAAEGAPITKIGPTQDVVASASALTPKTDNTVDLGSTTLEFKDLWIDGTANIDNLLADALTVSGTSSLNAKTTVQLTSAATNTVTQAMRLDSQSSGTPAAGIGVGLEFAAETAAGNTEVGATLEAITTDVTATSEDFDLSVKLMIAGAAATEVARFKPTGLTLATGDTYQINNTDVLSATTLGSGVVTSSLTSVGTIGTGTWQGTVVGSTYGGTGINNAGRTLTISTNSGTIAFSGASTTMTFPAASATLAGLGTTQTFTGINTFTPAARTSGVASYFTLTTPADTGQTASTESIGANFTAATRTWATGALTLQRERVFAAPTYAFAGASTLTTAVNVDIAAPVAGANATITNAYALRAAASQFTGAVNITGLTASKPVFTDANKNLTSTGTVPVDQGGTGQTTYTDGQLLIGNTTGNTLTKATLTAGSGVSITNGAGSISISATGLGGDVVGPASSTDNAVVRFDGATGKLVQNSAVTIADTTGNITGGAYNKVTITAPATSATLTIADGKTLTANNSLTLAGTDATTMTFPTTSASIARTDADQTFTGTQTVLAAATQDAVALAGRAGGTSSYITTITPGTLTASNTLTLPIVTGTLATTANTTQTFAGSTTFSSTFTLSGTTTNIALGTSQSSGTWTAGGTAQTGAMTLGRSTGAQTVNIATGATATATTKAVNIGTAGLSGSTTNLTYGSAVAGSTTTHVWNSGGTEAARLDSTGLGIGTSSPGAKLDVAGGKQRVTYNSTGLTSVAIYNSNNAANDGSGVEFGKSSADPFARVWSNHNSGTLYFDVTSTFPFVWRNTMTGTPNTLMTLDGSGNLGLGVTPSSWDNNFKAFQLGYPNFIAGNNGGNRLDIGVNAYFSTNYKYAASSVPATYYSQSSGAHTWYTAASGTAGNAISFTQAMTLDASGNLALGGTTVVGKLTVNGQSTDANNVLTGANIVAGTQLALRERGNSNGISGSPYVQQIYSGPSGDNLEIYTVASKAVVFGTAATERARIDSSGNVQIGTTTSNGRLSVDQGSSGTAGYFTTSGSTGTVILSDTGGNGAGIKFVGNGATTPNKYIRTNAGVLEFVNSAYSAVFATFSDAGAAYNLTGTWGTISDLRIKENVSTARNYLADLCRLRVVKYSLKSEKATSATKLGFIAQEVEEVFPNLVETSKNDFEGLDDMKQIKMSVLTPMLLKAVQELKAELDAVKAELATLKGS